MPLVSFYPKNLLLFKEDNIQHLVAFSIGTCLLLPYFDFSDYANGNTVAFPTNYKNI